MPSVTEIIACCLQENAMVREKNYDVEEMSVWFLLNDVWSILAYCCLW